MHRDSLRDVEGLSPDLDGWRKRVQAAQRSATRLQTIRDQIQGDLETRALEVTQLGVRIEKLVKVGELLRALMDKLVLDQVRTIETIVSEGLKTIFFDQKLTFEAEVSQKYNKVAIDFFLKQGEDSMAIRGNPMESFGGGPASIASFILRLLTLMRLKRAPLLFLDETLAAVSDDYIEPAGQFLRLLAERTGIDVLLVTHKQAFLDHATTAYQGHLDVDADTTWSLGLRRLRGPK